MKRLIDLYRDIRANPRETEGSSSVVRNWMRPEDAYNGIVPEVREADVYRRYCNLTAERVLYRRKIMALPVSDSILQNVDILNARPFGARGPALREVMESHVKVAMAFVPLTPREGVLDPVLARLYCVDGLKREAGAMPFTSDWPKCCAGHAWFLAGYGGTDGIAGRSWYLAAHLLVEAGTESGYRRNLASRLIVTGDVTDSRITKVEMGRKAELATGTGNEFGRLTWIIPFDNKEETSMINMMKAEYPKTLAECKELIETMQNKSTQALCKIANKGLQWEDAVLELLQNNADPCESVEASETRGFTDRCNARQRFGAATFAALVGQLRTLQEKFNVPAHEVEGIVSSLRAVAESERDLAYYGSIPQMLFLLARMGDEEALSRVVNHVDVNATDEHGETALDFADAHKERDAIALLEKLGANRRGKYELGSTSMQKMIRALPDEKAVSYVLTALEEGISPNEVFRLSLQTGTEYLVSESMMDLIAGPEGDYIVSSADEFFDNIVGRHRIVHRRYTTNLFLEALYSGNVMLARSCLDHGANFESEIEYAETSWDEKFDAPKSKTLGEPVTDKDFKAHKTRTIKDIVRKLSWGEFSKEIQSLIAEALKTPEAPQQVAKTEEV